MESNTSIKLLERIGLTRMESRAYLALIELKEAQTGALCQNSGIPSSHIYATLNSLTEKGLVSYRLKNNIKIFSSASPDVIHEILNEKKKKVEEERAEFNELIDNLKNIQNRESSISKFKYFEGITGIKSMMTEITEYLKEVDPNTTIKLHAGSKEAYSKLLDFYAKFHAERVRLNIKYKIIYPDTETKMGEVRKKQLSEVRYAHLTNKMEFLIVKDKLLLWYMDEGNSRSFLIDDEVFAQSHELIFDRLWEIAKENPAQ